MALDVYTVVLTGQVAGQMVQNVMSFQSDVDNAPNPGADAIKVNNGWDNTLLVGFLACMPTNFILSTIRSRRRNNGGGNSATKIPSATDGTWAGEASTALMGVQLHFPFTNGAGHYGTGKQFLAGAADNAVDDGKFTNPYLAVVNDYVQDLLAGYVDTGLNMTFGVWSPKLNSFHALIGGGISLKPSYIGRRLKPIF